MFSSKQSSDSCTSKTEIIEVPVKGSGSFGAQAWTKDRCPSWVGGQRPPAHGLGIEEPKPQSGGSGPLGTRDQMKTNILVKGFQSLGAWTWMKTETLVKGFRPLGARAHREDQCPSRETPISRRTGLDKRQMS